MNSLVPKPKENRLPKPSNPKTINPTIKPSIPCRTVVATTCATSQTSIKVPQLHPSVPIASSNNKTPDLLRPPKFGGQKSLNRKPDITKHLPVKTIQKPSQSPVMERPK